MGQTYSKMRKYVALTLTLLLAIGAVGAGVTVVFADQCTAQLSYPTMSMASGTSSLIQMTLPVSATCSPTSNALTAVGDAYDSSVNNDLGSVNTVLNQVSGGTFGGQLLFNLPTSSLGHNMQVSVSIYNGNPSGPGQYGTLLTRTSVAVQVNPNGYPNNYYQGQSPQQYLQQVITVTTFVTQANQQPFYYGQQYMNGSVQQPFARAPYSNRQDTSWWMGAVVALMIAVSVIVAVVFAVIATRNRQQRWQHAWPPRKVTR